jgi:predicted DNA-binding transcriptional regulator AlpA
MNKVTTGECQRNRAERADEIRLSPAERNAIIDDRNRWVSDTLAEHVTGIPRASLRRLRHEGRGPRYVKTGSSVRYKIAWLLEYIDQRTVETRDTARSQEVSA